MHRVWLSLLVQTDRDVPWVRRLVRTLVYHDVRAAALVRQFAIYELPGWWLRGVLGLAHLRQVNIMHPVVLRRGLDWVRY